MLVCFYSYLFYESIVAVIVFFPFVFFYVKKKKAQDVKREKWELNLQFREVLTAIAGELNAGYSLESSFEEAFTDLKNLYYLDTRIMKELERMIYGLKMNQTVEAVLMDFAERSKVEDIETFAEVVSISKRTGGDTIKVIMHTAKNIGDKIEVKRQIATAIAAKKLEVKIMSGVPAGIIIYMKLFSKDIMGVLYHNIIGVSIMSILLVLYIIAYVLSIRIVDIQL